MIYKLESTRRAVLSNALIPTISCLAGGGPVRAHPVVRQRISTAAESKAPLIQPGMRAARLAKSDPAAMSPAATYTPLDPVVKKAVANEAVIRMNPITRHAIFPFISAPRLSPWLWCRDVFDNEFLKTIAYY
ncbi:hypothetical protein A2732_02760 [Candidatus Nomurabacteria bacterium RIFCSPHIGHO2_01_FULL_40_10]|nr:MAG: hypothetical protein A2732_02760 [Candidatus Nomurabacteria bacterium RIFCSPHIGHO2_01_FULL_40_10]